MHYPFEFEIEIEPGIVVGDPVDGIAIFQPAHENLREWVLTEIKVEVYDREARRHRYVTLPDTHPLLKTVSVGLINSEKDEIDQAWANYTEGARAGNRADAQRDQALSAPWLV